MRLKDKHIRPENLIDEFEEFTFPNSTEKQLNATKGLLKSLVLYFSKEMKITPEIKIFQQEILQISNNLKKIKKITVFVQGTESVYNKPLYIFTNGKLLHAYLNKDILECNFYDIAVMKKKGLNPKFEIVQIFTGIAITLATVIESITKENLAITMTLNEGVELIQKIIKTYKHDDQQKYFKPVAEILVAIELYNRFDIVNKNISKPNFFEENPDYPYSIENAQKYRDGILKKAVEHLQEAINNCISIGLFKQYQRSPNPNKKIEKLPVICEGHTLLNNTKLLKKLNGSSLNVEGNFQKKRNYEEIDNKILELLKQDKFKNKYKSKNAASEKIADEIAKDIEIFMKNDLAHNQYIKLENLPTRILKLINKNPELYNYIINK